MNLRRGYRWMTVPALLIGNRVSSLPGCRITDFGAGARLDMAGVWNVPGCLNEGTCIVRFRAFAPFLASGANTAFAARVPDAMGLITKILVHRRLRVLRRADKAFIFFENPIDKPITMCYDKDS